MKTYLLIVFFIVAMGVGFATASSLIVSSAAMGAIATACLSHPETEPRKEPAQRALEKSLKKTTDRPHAGQKPRPHAAVRGAAPLAGQMGSADRPTTLRHLPLRRKL